MAGGIKKWKPTPEDIETIRVNSGLGLHQSHVALMVGKSLPTIMAYPECREAFQEGKAKTIAMVAGSLVSRALAGDTTSMIFYLKTQGGWKETTVQEHTGVMTTQHALLPPGGGIDFKKLSREEKRELDLLMSKASGKD